MCENREILTFVFSLNVQVLFINMMIVHLPTNIVEVMKKEKMTMKFGFQNI